MKGEPTAEFSQPIPTVEEAIERLGWTITPERFVEVFRIEGPALISFSGGRTSALMLWCILVAWGGTLPENVVVAFANTGKERGETLRFVHECGSRWGVPIRWVEWRDNEAGFESVGFNSASRNGEPFDALMDKKKCLPNQQERWCTAYLKVETMHALMRSLGHGEPGAYREPIGLRHDEGRRILRGYENAEKSGRRVCYPLGDAKRTKRDVRAFWFGHEDARYATSTRPQGFDLELDELWGNCDLCFAMGVAIRRERVRKRPAVATWWHRAELRVGGTFTSRESVEQIVRDAEALNSTLDLFDDLDDSECGTWCPTDDAA